MLFYTILKMVNKFVRVSIIEVFPLPTGPAIPIFIDIIYFPFYVVNIFGSKFKWESITSSKSGLKLLNLLFLFFIRFSIFPSNRITSYNVCYTKLLRRVIAKVVPARHLLRNLDVITSYSIHYTKLYEISNWGDLSS